MVTEEDVQRIMKEVFPRCPICGSEKGYKVTGTFKTYVECNDCGARWFNSEFVHPALKEMQLWEPPRRGEFAGMFTDVLKTKKPLEFWYEVNKEHTRYKEDEYSQGYSSTRASYEEALSKGQILITPEMSNEELLAGIEKDQTDFAHYFNQMTRGKGWDAFHILFSSGSDIERRQMWMTLSIINQNKIMIRQNELIRRALERINQSLISKQV